MLDIDPVGKHTPFVKRQKNHCLANGLHFRLVYVWHNPCRKHWESCQRKRPTLYGWAEDWQGHARRLAMLLKKRRHARKFANEFFPMPEAGGAYLVACWLQHCGSFCGMLVWGYGALTT